MDGEVRIKFKPFKNLQTKMFQFPFNMEAYLKSKRQPFEGWRLKKGQFLRGTKKIHQSLIQQLIKMLQLRLMQKVNCIYCKVS
jgi:hypothetical protein